MPTLPDPVIAALDAFAGPGARELTDPSELLEQLARLTMDAEWVDMGAAHPVQNDPEGIRRMLQKLGAEGRCTVLSTHGLEDDRDLGGALDGAINGRDGALLACRPGPLAFLVTASGERWLLSRHEPPALTEPLPVVGD